MTKFTKGPWEIEIFDRGLYQSAIVSTKHGFLTSETPIKIDDDCMFGESWIDMRERTEPARIQAKEESIANCYLIAAAPEMYECLEDYKALLALLASNSPHLQSKLDEATRVSKKARGES